MSDDDGIQRSLGRIEGTQSQILQELRHLRNDFSEHKQEDQKNFSSVRALFYDKLREQDDKRETHLADQDKKLDAIKTAQDTRLAAIQSTIDKAKGASWAIRSLWHGISALIGGLAALAAEAIKAHLHW